MPAPTDTMREKQLNLRVSAEELARLELVAEHYGLNIAATIRMLAKREADRIAADAAPAPRTTKKSRSTRS